MNKEKKMTLASYQKIVPATGAAKGRITGFNHLVMLCTDLNRSTIFYRDILGLKVVRTQPERRTEYERQYFFELGNGELLSLYQSQKMSAPERPLVNSLWPDSRPPSTSPQKLDHLAFNVDTLDDLYWFQERLRNSSVPVSKVWVSEAGFLAGRIYFNDPDGNPLEIATYEKADPKWDEFDNRVWLREEHPVPALFRESEID